MYRRNISGVAAIAVTGVLVASAGCSGQSAEAHNPGQSGTSSPAGNAASGGSSARVGNAGVPGVMAQVNPADFAHPRGNPYYPLKPGMVTTYVGSDGGAQYRETVEVTNQTKTIVGVRATVTSDVLRRSDGSLAEKTSDWYAADNQGNVWYFGEATGTYDKNGKLNSREGSWQAGVHGAKAGIIMPASPAPTDAYRQEWYAGHAEDQAWISDSNASVTVPYGSVKRVVRSYEWSRLEPNVVSMKLYGPGLGIVAEKDVSGGTEQFQLKSVVHR
jgi:hypothetical protein